MFDLVIKGGICVVPGKNRKLTQVRADVGIKGGKVAQLGSFQEGAEVLNVKGLHVLPGLIDSQVHFREPGLEHKEDLSSGTRSAVLGGITTVFDMPNTRPSITTTLTFNNKVLSAQGRCWSHYAFYVGANPENISQLCQLEDLSGCCGIKIFLGSSTGDLLIKDYDLLQQILSTGHRRVAIHSEDESRLEERRVLLKEQRGRPAFHPQWRDEEVALTSTRRLLEIARQHSRPVHVLHVTTGQEMELLKGHKDIASVECTPQHLTLCAPECYEELGTLAQMNPPIRGASHREKLWEGVRNGTVDVIGSDHAPHTKEEKSRPYPLSPSGMPGVQTMVPIMLNHIHKGLLSLEKWVELMCVNPVRLFGIKNKGALQEGFDADITIVDLHKESEITTDWLAYKCGWSPFEGQKVTGWPMMTLLKGEVVMNNAEVVGSPRGELLDFS